MSRGSALELVRLVICLLGGVMLALSLFELLLRLDVIMVFEDTHEPDFLAAIAGLGVGLLRYGGPRGSGRQ
jgi:hypothetical protein